MLVNSATKILVDGIQISHITKVSVNTSTENAFFFCEFETDNDSDKKEHNYVVRDITRKDHSIIIECISTGKL